MSKGRKNRVGAIARENRFTRDVLKAEALRAKADALSHAHKQALIAAIKDGNANKRANRNTPASLDALLKKRLNKVQKLSTPSKQARSGKVRRACVVCGRTTFMWPQERMCFTCRTLPTGERRRKRATRKGNRRRSPHTVSGGLPSLGKRQ
jgi:hypothetical protein